MSRVERHKNEYSKADRKALENIKPSEDPKDIDFAYGNKEAERATAESRKAAPPAQPAPKSGRKASAKSQDEDLGIWDQTEEEKKRARQEAKAMGDGRPEFHGGRVLGKFIGFIGTLILILAIVACLGLFVPHYAGIEQYVVRNGNMAPAISVGSMIYTAQTEPSTLEAGNIIVYKGGESDGSPVTSRVVENRLADGEVITKGDANPQNDPSPVKYTDILGKKVLSVPMLGYIAAPMATIFGKVAMGLVIIGAYILTVIGARLRRV